MVYRVATVSFLNCLPLVEWFATPEGAEKVSLQSDMPSRLAPLLASGSIDVALLPTVEILKGASAGIVGSSGIACHGAVDSVKFYYCGPLSSLRAVDVDRGSRTSVALLRVLLAETVGVSPLLRVVEPIPGTIPAPGEGVLVIGDRCFAFDRWLRSDTGAAARVSCLDLGEAWLAHTGLPFVFAAWAAAPSLAARGGQTAMRDVGSILMSARDYGLQRLDVLAAREAAGGSLGPGGIATPAALEHYFRTSLHYCLRDLDLVAIDRFRMSCIDLGILSASARSVSI